MIDKDKKAFHVLFVCTGNTCRSPMAEGILKKLLEERNVKGIAVSSAGTHGLHNAPASLFAIQVAKARQVDISEHRSQELNPQMLQQADIILVMSEEHLTFIKRLDDKATRRACLLRAFALLKPESNEAKDPGVLSIKDPIGGSPEDYEKSFYQIEREIERIIPELLRLAGKS
jgi:protein-tyrosine-phosphatase